MDKLMIYLTKEIKLESHNCNEADTFQTKRDDIHSLARNSIGRILLKEYDNYREMVRKDFVKYAQEVEISKGLLLASIPKNLLNMKMSEVIKKLSLTGEEEFVKEPKRNCYSFACESEMKTNTRMALFDLTQMPPNENNNNKIPNPNSNANKNFSEKTNLERGIHVNENSTNTMGLNIANAIKSNPFTNKTDNFKDFKEPFPIRTQEIQKTPCFSKVKSQKEISASKINKNKLLNKENEDILSGFDKNSLIPKVKSTKGKDLTAFAARYKSPSPLINKKGSRSKGLTSNTSLNLNTNIVNNNNNNQLSTPAKTTRVNNHTNKNLNSGHNRSNTNSSHKNKLKNSHTNSPSWKF